MRLLFFGVCLCQGFSGLRKTTYLDKLHAKENLSSWGYEISQSCIEQSTYYKVNKKELYFSIYLSFKKELFNKCWFILHRLGSSTRPSNITYENLDTIINIKSTLHDLDDPKYEDIKDIVGVIKYLCRFTIYTLYTSKYTPKHLLLW